LYCYITIQQYNNINNLAIQFMIWKVKPSMEALEQIGKNTLSDHIGIEWVEIGDVLAETIGSVASHLAIGIGGTKQVVGIEINANHLSSAREGTYVFGTVKPIRIGRTIQVWNIEIKDERDKLVCVSRLTCAIVER
jgi:1,4-dihydroxy-2-naphthoyl-CoA hydrolase